MICWFQATAPPHIRFFSKDRFQVEEYTFLLLPFFKMMSHFGFHKQITELNIWLTFKWHTVGMCFILDGTRWQSDLAGRTLYLNTTANCCYRSLSPSASADSHSNLIHLRIRLEPAPNGSRRALLLRLQWPVQSPHINSFHHLWHAVGAPPSQSCFAIVQAGKRAPFQRKKEVQQIRGWMHLISCVRTKCTFRHGRLAKG